MCEVGGGSTPRVRGVTGPPALSVVIPAFNEERYLPATIRALDEARRAIPGAVEVIVADDASSDRTAEIAAAAGCRVVPCHYRQIARTRNAGAAVARADRLLFLDADTRATPEAMAAMWRAFEAGAVGGGGRMRFDGGAPTRLAAAGIGLWNALSRACRLAAGGFLFARADAFRAVGGFPEDLYASEEITLSRNLRRWGAARGMPFVILREAVFTSDRKFRLYAPAEMRRMALAALLRGRRALRDREALGAWYDGRR